MAPRGLPSAQVDDDGARRRGGVGRLLHGRWGWHVGPRSWQSWARPRNRTCRLERAARAHKLLRGRGRTRRARRPLPRGAGRACVRRDRVLAMVLEDGGLRRDHDLAQRARGVGPLAKARACLPRDDAASAPRAALLPAQQRERLQLPCGCALRLVRASGEESSLTLVPTVRCVSKPRGPWGQEPAPKEARER